MLKNIKELLSATPKEIIVAAEKELVRIGYTVIRDPEDLFIFAVPPQFQNSVETKTSSVYTNVSAKVVPLFCAHIDVIGVNPPKRADLILNPGKNKISLAPESKAECLGADDRAGIFALFKILRSLHKINSTLPFVVLTDQEEVRGVGAKAVANSRLLQQYVNNVSCYIELDRRGSGEFVSYDPCGLPNKELGEMFLSQGFVLNCGSYSDVADFTPVTNVTNVNLSVGYRDEHSKNEVLFLDELELTIARVLRLWKYCPELFTKIFEAEKRRARVECDYDGFGYPAYDALMDSVFQLAAVARTSADIPALVKTYVDSLGAQMREDLIEGLEEVVEDLNYSNDETDILVSEVLVDLLFKELSEEDEIEGLGSLREEDGFYVNQRGTVVGRIMNRAGCF